MRTLLSLGLVGLASTLLFAAASGTGVSAAPAAARPTVATTYAVDLSHSNILFRCKHLDVSYQWGRFDDFDGSFTLDEDASKSNVSITVQATSVNSNSKDRDDHLRGPDFFSVKEFPEMTFRSTKVEKADGDQYKITGDLTLHGVTKSITMEATKIGEADTRMGQRAGFEGRFVIDRNDFGIKTYPGVLGDDVTMTFAIEGEKTDE